MCLGQMRLFGLEMFCLFVDRFITFVMRATDLTFVFWCLFYFQASYLRWFQFSHQIDISIVDLSVCANDPTRHIFWM